MNTTHVAGRVRAFGGRLHATVRRFFESPLGPDARPLEIREAMLEDVEKQVTPVGDGRRVFPFARLVARVVAPAGSRGTCEATFSDFDSRVRARLAELRCELPRNLDVRVVVLRKAPADWETGRIFALDYRQAPEVTAVGTDAPRPVLQVTVLAGAATQPAYTVESPMVFVGRGVEPVDQAGRVRRNHVAFAEEADDVAETVGRAHARFTWDPAAGEYRVFDEGSSNGTRVLRGGASISVPSRDPRGVRVRSGDEIQFGRARVRIKVRTIAAG
jgi:FHA domain